MKHVIILTTSYPVSSDGSEAAGSFVADFAETLARSINVTVVAPALKRNKITLSKNLSVFYFAVTSLPLSLIKPYNPLNWVSIIKTIKNGYIELSNVLKNYGADHIFALWALPSGFWAYIARIKFGIPYSIWALGSDIWDLGSIPIVKQLLKIILSNSKFNYADGYLLKDSVERISQKKCHFLPSTRNFPIAAGKKLSDTPPYKFAFIGRWHPNKGIDLLLESLLFLKDNDWEKISEIVISGGGPFDQYVRTHVNQLIQLGYPLTLKGFINKTEAANLLIASDFLLIPSRIESIPVIFSDSIKCFTPVIANPVGDLPFIIRKYNVGIVSTDASSKSFSNAISFMLDRSPVIFETGIEQAYKAFDIKNVADNFLKMIKQGNHDKRK